MITDPAARTARESALETSFPQPNACSGTSEAACWLAALGLPVAPGAFGEKVPNWELLGRGFHWPDVASTDPRQVSGWFTRPWHFSTILLACGVEFGVLDIDVKSGENGYESVAALEDEIGAPLTSQLGARTPSGAEHRYFSLTPVHGRVPSVNRLRPGLDFKGWGGYVLAPPSHIKVRPAPSQDPKDALLSGRRRVPDRWEPYLWQRPDVPPFAPIEGTVARLLGTPPPLTAETVWWPTGRELLDALSASSLPRELLPVLARGAVSQVRQRGARGGRAGGATVPIEQWRRHGLPTDVDHDKALYRAALSLLRRGATDAKTVEVLTEIAGATRLKVTGWQWSEKDFARHLRSGHQWLAESDKAQAAEYQRSADALLKTLRST